MPSFKILAANAPPTVAADNASVSGNEGGPAITNTGTYNDADGDTVSISASIGSVVKSGTSSGTWTWTSPPPTDGPAGPTTVTITADDGNGGITTTTFTYSVNNVSPTINTFTLPTGVLEGGTANLAAAATDPAGANDPLVYTWTVTGPAIVGSLTLTGTNPSFTPGDNGTFNVSLTVTDGDGGSATTSGSFNVGNVAPTATASSTLLNPVVPSPTQIIARNSPYTFSMANVVDPATVNDTYQLEWDWNGDGTPEVTMPGITYAAASVGTFSQTYHFPTVGIYNVTMRVRDEDGGVTSYVQVVDARAVLVMPNGELHIGGTDASNIITIDQGPSPSVGSQNLRVFIDGVYYGTYGPVAGPGVTDTFTGPVRIFAGGLEDVVTIIGTTGADDFTIDDDVVPAQLTHDKSFSLNGRTYTTRDGESYILRGLEGNDTFTIDGLGAASGASTQNVSIEGGNGNDQLIAGPALLDADGDLGPDSIATWNIQGPQRGTLETVLKFNTIEAIVANDEDNTVVVNHGGSMTNLGAQAAITMGSGTNILDLSAVLSGAVITVDTTGVLTTTAGRVTGVDSLIGTAGGDRLIGATQANTWDISATNAGTYTSGGNDPIAFSSIESLTGGGNTDTFSFVGGDLTGSLDGGAGADTADYSTVITPINTTLSPAKTSLVGGTWAGIESFVGGTGNNTLTATSATNTWTLTGVGAGTLNTTLAFSNYANLVGGTVVDKFLMGPAAVFTSVNGSSGTDTLSYATYGAAVSVDLVTTSSGVVDGTMAFSGIDSLVGSTSADSLIGTAAGDTILITALGGGKVNTTTSFSSFENLSGDSGNDKYTIQTTLSLATMTIDAMGGLGDTLTGPNQVNAWSISGLGQGTLNGMAFDNVENLTGGTGNDTFDFSAGGTVTGIVTGGNGNDVLNVDTNDVTLTSATAGSSAVLGTFASIENLISAGGTLNGANIANVWKLTGSNTGRLNGTTNFSGFVTINGGTSTDKLQLSTGTLTGSFNAGAGTDTLDYSGVTTIVRPYTPLVTDPTVADGMGGTIAITGFNLLTGNL